MDNSPIHMLSKRSQIQSIHSSHLSMHKGQAQAKLMLDFQATLWGAWWLEGGIRAISVGTGNSLSFDLGASYFGVFSL